MLQIDPDSHVMRLVKKYLKLPYSKIKAVKILRKLIVVVNFSFYRLPERSVFETW